MTPQALLLLQNAPALPDYRGALLQSLLVMSLVLGGLALLIWAVRHGRLGAALRQGRRLRIVEQLPLSLKHQIYVVRVDDEDWVLGCGEGASPVLLTKKPSVSSAGPDVPPPSFRAVWQKAMGKPPASDETESDSGPS